jgi:hypothetical protein
MPNCGLTYVLGSLVARNMYTKEQIALHRNWLRADAIKDVLFVDNSREREKASKSGLSEELRNLGEKQSTMFKMEIMYSLLYVTIEGYKEIGAQFPSLDALLANEEYVDCLRKFRNHVFHFQSQPFTEKLLGFLEAEGSEHWMQNIHKEFGQFFLQILPIEKTIQSAAASIS